MLAIRCVRANKGGQVLLGGEAADGQEVGCFGKSEPPRRIAFTYLFASEGEPGESLVTVTLGETAEGTLLHLRHDFASAKLRDHHVQGWRHQLAVFSKILSEEEHARVAERVDAFLRAFGDPDAATRRALLESCATPGIAFRDAFSATAGMDDMLANLDAVQVHMPGITLVRSGDVRLSHGTAIAGYRPPSIRSTT